MKIVAKYANRVIADSDSNYLMSHGIASVVYGDDAPQCLTEYFGSEPIYISVQDDLSDKAKELLTAKKKKDLIMDIPRWFIRHTKTKISKS
ncbi:MAG: hypothetical protein LBH05_08490 [Deferribacteraceae bacterium]|jgi:hypothetical protein|nr:hypothetical protein [Deferribacteraceae bacterium]